MVHNLRVLRHASYRKVYKKPMVGAVVGSAFIVLKNAEEDSTATLPHLPKSSVDGKFLYFPKVLYDLNMDASKKVLSEIYFIQHIRIKLLDIHDSTMMVKYNLLLLNALDDYIKAIEDFKSLYQSSSHQILSYQAHQNDSEIIEFQEKFCEIPKIIKNAKVYAENLEQCEKDILDGLQSRIAGFDIDLHTNFDDSLNLVIENAGSDLKDIIFLMYGSAKRLDAQIESIKIDESTRLKHILLVCKKCNKYNFSLFLNTRLYKRCIFSGESARTRK